MPVPFGQLSDLVRHCLKTKLKKKKRSGKIVQGESLDLISRVGGVEKPLNQERVTNFTTSIL